MNSHKKGTDYVLEQETYAQEQVELALKEKDTLLKKAKDSAGKEIITYEEERRELNYKKTTELNSNRNIVEDIETKNQYEILEVEKEFNKNRDKVVEYLFNNTIQVDIVVPEVVKGKFEERFGLTNN